MVLVEGTLRLLKKAYIISLVFFVAALLFWGVCYRGHISFAEEQQLFLFTSDYFQTFVGHPGGLVEYVGAFLTQFFFQPWIGALIMALCISLVQILSYRVLVRFLKSYWIAIVLSIVLASLIWLFMTNIYALLSLPLSLICAFVAMILYSLVKRYKLLCAIIMSIILYYIAGPVHFLFVGFVICKECTLLSSVVMCIAAVALPIIASFLVQYPIIELMTGVGYQRVHFSVQNDASLDDEEQAMRYSHLARYRRWGDIIEMAASEKPVDLSSQQCLNLALAQKGVLLDKLFEFAPKGVSSLISDESDCAPLIFPVSEVYYHIGMVTKSEHAAFNSQEVMHSFSSRAFIRMAECALLHGEKGLVSKYAHSLEKTLYYKKWAIHLKEAVAEDNLLSNKEWRTIKSYMLNETGIYSDEHIYLALAKIIDNANNAQLAHDYLVAYLLLKCEVEKIEMMYAGREDVQLPRYVQEALLYSWMQRNPSLERMPWRIENSIVQRALSFVKAYANRISAETLKEKYGDTFWYYCTSIE
ncbi:MAG: DUF6057 family protein [Bacteroidales bacterium]|nr:DUF6057 family protein [Bacteroidales bacterium]